MGLSQWSVSGTGGRCGPVVGCDPVVGLLCGSAFGNSTPISSPGQRSSGARERWSPESWPAGRNTALRRTSSAWGGCRAVRGLHRSSRCLPAPAAAGNAVAGAADAADAAAGIAAAGMAFPGSFDHGGVISSSWNCPWCGRLTASANHLKGTSSSSETAITPAGMQRPHLFERSARSCLNATRSADRHGR